MVDNIQFLLYFSPQLDRISKEFLTTGVWAMTLEITQATTKQAIGICQGIRHKVFVVGQGIDPAIEQDGMDAACLHFLGTYINEMHNVRSDHPAAAARIFPQGDTARIQRLAVLEEFRGRHFGVDLMRFMITLARGTDYRQITLGAQLNVVDFYTKLGFTAVGEVYKEVGIIHQEMVMTL